MLQSNPGNFANRPKEEVQEIASKGGKTGTENSGFASMPQEKVVSGPHSSNRTYDLRSRSLTLLSSSKRSLPRAARPLPAPSSPVARRPRRLVARADPRPRPMRVVVPSVMISGVPLSDNILIIQ